MVEENPGFSYTGKSSILKVYFIRLRICSVEKFLYSQSRLTGTAGLVGGRKEGFALCKEL